MGRIKEAWKQTTKQTGMVRLLWKRRNTVGMTQVRKMRHGTGEHISVIKQGQAGVYDRNKST